VHKDLDDFLKQYEYAANSCDFDKVAPLIAKNAVFWFTNETYRGKAAIKKAFEETWAKIKTEQYKIFDIEWLVNEDNIAVCIYSFTSDGIVDGKRQVYKGRGTNILSKNDSKWYILHEHLSKVPGN
jgi:ketosteroid isomerase-like protein